MSGISLYTILINTARGRSQYRDARHKIAAALLKETKYKYEPLNEYIRSELFELQKMRGLVLRLRLEIGGF
jgi:hypothetical protein